MKTRVLAIFASLCIHAIILGAYFANFGLQNKPIESKAKAAASINLSMFEAPAMPVQPTPELPAPIQPQAQPKPPPPKIVKKTEPKKTAPPKIKPKPIKQKTKTPKPQAPDKAKAPVTNIEKVTPKPVPVPEKKPVQPAKAVRDDGISDAEREGLENPYKNAVRQSILKNRIYPRQARRKRQQGTVVVAFRLRKSGEIEKLRVVTSSGIAQLDRAALEAVDKVRQFDPFPAGVPRHIWDFEIPVSFKLL